MTFCFCFLLGVFLVSVWELKIDFVYLYFALFVVIGGLAVFWQNKRVRFVLFILLFFSLGFGRYSLAFTKINIKEGEADFLAYVVAEPDVRSDGVRYILERQYTKEKIYWKSSLYPRYEYGDELKVVCEIKKPEASEDFRYDMYLARYGVFAECMSAQVKKIDEDGGNFVFRGIFGFKNVVASKIGQLWHEPYASFMAGLLYGYRGGLGELNDMFSRTGITHIVAISGYNITIIVSILITFCVQVYIPRKKAFWIIVGGIILFVLFTGASASVVRAGIMGIIVLLSKQTGRLSRIGNVLLLTAVVMVLQNPLVLVWDAGFQLSFISTCGLVYLSPLFVQWFKKLPEKFGIKESLISTLSAIMATLPLILFQFGRLSIVAPVVNILVLWIIPYLMLIGFVATVFGFVFFPLGQVLAWVGLVGLKYIVFVVKWFSGLPFAAIDLKISWWVMVVLYGFILYLVFKSKKYVKS